MQENFPIIFCQVISVHSIFSQSSLQHEALHEKHKGHESMHAEMVLILLTTLVVSQILLVFWRTRHLKSFQVSVLNVILFSSPQDEMMPKT
jgi:hypothetical protein